MTSVAQAQAGKVISQADLERIAGFEPAPRGDALIGLPILPYRGLAHGETRNVLEQVDRDLETRAYRQTGDHAPEVWQRGWSEVADRLTDQAPTIESLRPGYFRDERIFRFDGQIVEGLEPFVEFHTSMALRRLLLGQYLADATKVAELGCGTGVNILLLAEAYPQMRIIGSDWVPASQRIVEGIGRAFPGRIGARRFDMLTAEGWDGQEIDHETVVLTVHALEQLNTHWRTCLDFILARGPRLCLHIEPLAELYDPKDPDDARMLRYHRKRGYLEGYVPAVQALAAAGQAQIVDLRRIAFSGLYHEAYSVLAWRPIS